MIRLSQAILKKRLQQSSAKKNTHNKVCCQSNLMLLEMFSGVNINEGVSSDLPINWEICARLVSNAGKGILLSSCKSES